MTKISYLLGFLLLTGICGCNLNSLKTIDLPLNLDQSFNVNIGASDSSSISENFVVDASSNADVQKYLSKIQNYTVKKVSYVVKNYTGSAGTTLSGQFKFGTISQNITNLDLQSASTNQTVYDLQFNQAALDALAIDLKDGNKVSGSLVGSISNKPAAFDVAVTFDIVLKASI
jgi:hypothetical protein